MTSEQATVHADVLIVGAGLSGIGAAHHLQTGLPGTTYTILEARETIGGTWDLFRYPGVRSDSDMHTLVPAMAEKAAHVTMLQRSPTYVMSLPPKDPVANGLRAADRLPKSGPKAPWRLGMNYAHDVVTLRHGRIRDGVMRFSGPDQGRG